MTDTGQQLVAQLHDEALNLNAAGWENATQDAVISGMLAQDAADWIEAAIAREAKLRGLLAELYAIVKGECPSLFNGDSGGDAVLELDICDALEATNDH